MAVPGLSLFPVQGAPSLAAISEPSLAVMLTLLTWYFLGSGARVPSFNECETH